MKLKQLKLLFIAILFVLSLAVINLIPSHQALAARSITFPIIGPATYSNDYYAARGSQTHNAIDILAKKGQKLVAVVSGTITRVNYPEPSWGYSVSIRDADGYRYNYLHINDDTPGTNDGKGGGMNAYAADIREGNLVARGQHIGQVGDSGNSNGVSHLHFEMRLPNGKVANPYQSLVGAKHISKAVVPGRVTAEILPYGRYSKPGVNIAMGNFDLDPALEFVAAASKGGGPSIKVYDDDGSLTTGFLAYNSGFRGGVDVATGDVDGDGIDEIITTAELGGAHIRVFAADGTIVTGFFAYGLEVKNGLKVTTGDTTGDTKDEIIVGLGAGTEPRVKVYDLSSGQPTLIRSFLAYKSTFRGGVDVAAGELILASPFDEIVTAPGAGGQPQIRLFQSDGTFINDFLAYKASMKGGVRLSIGNVRTGTIEEEILTVPASIGNPQIKIFSNHRTLVASTMFIEEWWIGGYDIAAGYDTSKATVGGNRRASIRPGIE